VFITWVQLGLFAHDLWSNFAFPILVKVLLFCVHENMQCKFYLEGGTMVLASGRVVYINEFDKMWPKDLIVFLAHNISCKQFIELSNAKDSWRNGCDIPQNHILFILIQ
jgi:hypothetical protein